MLFVNKYKERSVVRFWSLHTAIFFGKQLQSSTRQRELHGWSIDSIHAKKNWARMCRTKYSTSWELRSTMADESRMTKTNSSYQRVSSKEWYWSEWRCELHSQRHGSITATERLPFTLCSPGSWPRLFVQKRWIRKINTSDLGSQGTRHMQRQSHLTQSEHGYSHYSLHVIEKGRLVCTILVSHRYSSSGIYFAPGAENVEVSEPFCQSVA